MQMNGIAAPLFFVSPNQINFQVPWELAGTKQALLTVTNGGAFGSATIFLEQSNPGIYSLDQSGSGQGAILIANSIDYAAPSGSIAGQTSRPVSRGEFITIYCTGLGAVSNRPSTGSPPRDGILSSTDESVFVTIGNLNVPRGTNDYSGLVPGYVGLYQVNVRCP